MKRFFVSVILLIAGAVAFQGAQCTSKEMTTAQIAKSNKDYAKAREYVNKELQNQPNSFAAYQLLAEIEMDQGNWIAAAENSNKALKNAQEPTVVENIKKLQYQIWSKCYNKGLEFYNMYLSKSDDALLDSALNRFEAGTIVRPEFEDFYYLKAITNELQADTSAAIKNYENYIDKIQAEIDYMTSAGAYLQMPRTETLQKFGEPAETTGQKPGAENDSMLVDLYKNGGKETYVFYYSENRGPFKLSGLRVDPSSNWLPFERKISAEMKKAPFAALSQIYFQKNDLNNSLKYAELITKLDPTDQQASRFVIELYTRMDKVDVAKEKLDKFIKNDPSNKLYYAQYGDIYLNQQEYKSAIEKYEEALEIDPEFSFALRNVASAYKNYASQLQDAQQDKMEKDPKFEMNTDEYFPYLSKSAQYFERCLDTKEFKNDYQVLGELTNIYSVLEKEDQLKATLKKLEAIEFSVPKADKESYYYILLKVYSDMGDEDKMNTIQKKLDKIK